MQKIQKTYKLRTPISKSDSSESQRQIIPFYFFFNTSLK